MSNTHILTPTVLAIAAPTAIITYFIGLVIHRLYFHPLAKYPGNFIDKITDWKDVYLTFTGNRHLVHHALHEKYGDFVRINPNTLSVNTAAGLKDIYSAKANVRKSDWYLGLITVPGVSSTHSAINKTEHSTKRRIMGHAFSDAALRSMEPQMTTIIDEWTTALANQPPTKPIDMATWTNYLSLDILGKLCFGESFHTLSAPTNRWAMSALMENVAIRYPHGFAPILYTSRLLRRLVYGSIPPFTDNPFTRYARGAVEKRMSPGFKSTDKDFISWLIDAKDPTTGDAFTLPQVWAESSLLIAAGSDTSSTALSALLFYLTRHPDKLAKLAAELHVHFPSVHDIHSGPALTGCVYLRACIDEALRLAPPVPAILPRTALLGGMSIDGHDVPAGVTVGVGAYAIHHNAAYYPEPFAFRPERWIVHDNDDDDDDDADGESNEGVSEESVHLAKEAFCPFSIGHRGCIGKNMAYLELQVAVGRLLYLFDIESRSKLGEGDGVSPGRERKGEFQLYDRFICAKEGPEVGFSKRKREGVVAV